MAFGQSHDLQRPSSQLSIDRKPSLFFDDLDISDEPLAMVSPTTTTDDRRDSFGNSTAPIFSPQSTVWEDFSTTMPERQFSMSGNPFTEQSNNPFLRPDSSNFGQHNSQWPMFDHASESRTPIVPATYEPFTGDFDAPTSSAFPHVASAASAFNGLPSSNVRPASVFPPAPTPTSLATSPPPGKDWMSIAEQSSIDSRPVPKRMRQSSPPRPYSPFPRRDGGIRKKNARFDIPPERSLANIDQLIANSNNDDEIKELKQQKRLLRNRQAALDSRQRKKQRAEELEEENKKWTERISLLEDEMSKLHMQVENHVQEKEQLMRERVQFQEQIQEMTWEKENMVQEHTLATGDLRKKISILTERLEIVTSATPSQPGSNDYDFTNEMNGLTMDPNDWDFLVNDFCMESEPTPQPKSQETSLVLAPKKKEALVDEEKPVASGLLMLLLLCGAWVATKTTSSSAPVIPRMPDDIRAASAVVLDNVMKDAGVQPAALGLDTTSRTAVQVKQVAFAMPGSAHSTDRLDAVHSKLVGQTKEQEAEAAFSLSVRQYNSLTSTDFERRGYGSDDDAGSPSSNSASHRRNLADTLKAMRDEAKGDTADVYTRSLLWDRIPSEVVQEFKRIVDESTTTGGD